MIRVFLAILLVDKTALLCTEVFISHNASNNIMFIEGTHPSLRDFILDFVLYLDLVRALSKCGLNRLLVQLIELVIEPSNHVLDLS